MAVRIDPRKRSLLRAGPRLMQILRVLARHKFLGAVGAQWKLRRALARADQSLGHYDASVRAHVDRRFPRVTALQAAC
jgi:hypothetical protein